MAVIAAPLDTTQRFVKLYKEPRDLHIEIVYENGDSYVLKLEEMKLLLLGLRLKKRVIEEAIDLLWNHYAVQIDLRRHEYLTIQPKPIQNIYHDPELSEHAWIL